MTTPLNVHLKIIFASTASDPMVLSACDPASAGKLPLCRPNYIKIFIHHIREADQSALSMTVVTSCVGFPSGSFICILNLRDLFSYILVEFSITDFLKKCLKQKRYIIGNIMWKVEIIAHSYKIFKCLFSAEYIDGLQYGVSA